MTGIEIAVNFAITLLSDKVQKLLDPNLIKRILACYDRARKEWKCDAARDRYEGKEFQYLEELKQYVIGKNGELDMELKELISRWVLKMQSDPVCASYLNSLKEDEILSLTSSFHDLASEILKIILSVKEDISEIKGAVNEQRNVINDIRENGRHTRDTVDSIAAAMGIKGASADNADSASLTVKLQNHLHDRLDHIRKYHPSFRLMKIDDSLFPGGISELHIIEAANDANEIKTVREIVEESWNREKKNHLMIEGEGGVGKTVTLLSLPDKFVPHKVPAVYIQLHELKGVKEDETIETYIKDKYFSSKDDLFRLFLKLADEPWIEGPQVLLLLDGFNEIAPERRYIIGTDINRWSERSGVQIVTSSRYDIHSYVPLGDDYSRILLQSLRRETIEDYLDRMSIPRPKNERQWKIIEFPLMLTLYAQTEKAIKELDRIDQQWFRNSDSAGAIIWNYLQREIWRFQKTPANIVKCVLSNEFVAPYIAWQMTRENRFFIEKHSFRKYVKEACEKAIELRMINEDLFPPHIVDVLYDCDDTQPRIKDISKFLEKDLHLFVKRNDGSYGLMHQQFRDALAALHLINVSYSSPGLPEEWITFVDNYVMSFVVELTPKEVKEGGKIVEDWLWNQNRCSDAKSDISTINMLELQKRKRNYDFSELDFSELDLRNISLFPYRVPGTSNLILPHNPELSKNLHVSEKTFYPERHLDRITVLVFTPDGKRFVSGSYDKTLRVWDIESGQCLWTLKGHGGGIWSLSITPDGRRCVSGSGDKTLRVWDIESGQCLNTLKGHEGGISSLSITPDGKRCVSGSHDKTLRVWDIESGQCLGTMKGHTDWIPSLSITSDGKRLLYHNHTKGTIEIIDMADLNSSTDLSIHIFPVFLKGANLALADVPEDLKETLRQNGASFEIIDTNR